MAINRNNSLNRGFIGVDKRVGNEGIIRPRSEYLDALTYGRMVEYDFTTGSYFTPVRISRLSTGTFINPNGVLAKNYDQLRITHGPTTGATLGVLVESQTINYIAPGNGNGETINVYGSPFVYFTPNYTLGFTSTQAATGGWSIINFGGVSAPDGLTTAELYVPGGRVADSVKNNYAQPGFPAGSTHGVWSIFAKVHGVTQEGMMDNSFSPGATAPTRLLMSDMNSGTLNVQFNIMNGTIISQAGVSAAWIENYGNGWYRCSVAIRPNSSMTTGLAFNVCPFPIGHSPGSYGPSYQGYTSGTPGQTGMMLWGFMAELGRYYPTSYVFTGFNDSSVASGSDGVSRSAITRRRADEIYISDVSWLQFPGTFYVEYYRRDGIGSGTNIPTNTIISTDNVSGRFICVDHVPSGTTVALRWSGGFTTAPGGVTGLNRVAFSVTGVSGASSSVQIVLNGGTASGVATSDFNIDAARWITIGSRSTGLTSGYSNFYDGIIRRVRFYPRAMSAQEMRDLTRA